MNELKKDKKHNRSLQDGIFFLILSLGLFCYGITNHYREDIAWSLSPYLFPVLISLFLFFLSLSLIRSSLKNDEEIKEKSNENMLKTLFVAVVSISYYVLLHFISFVPSTILFLIVLFMILGEKRWKIVLPVSVLSSLFIYFIFGKMLGVMLP